mgnify:FL=1
MIENLFAILILAGLIFVIVGPFAVAIWAVFKK